MSKSSAAPSLVIEWSPSGVTAYDPAHRTTVHAPTLEELGLGGRTAVLAVSRRSAFVKAVRVPNAAADEVELVLQTQMATIFPVPLGDLSYSFRLTDEVGPEGRLAVVAAMRESDLRTMLDQAKAASIRVDRVLPAAFGSMLLAQEVGLASTAVVQPTTEGLAIDLIDNKELLYSRVSSVKTAVEAEVSRSFTAVGLAEAPTLAAGGLNIPSADSLTPMTSLEALALLDLGKLGIHLETREARERRQKKQRGQRTRMAALLTASALLLAAFVWVERTEQAESVARGQATWNSQLTILRKKRSSAQTELANAQKLQTIVNRGFAPAQTPFDVLTVASNLAPDGLWLTSLTFDRGKPMYLRGAATTNTAVSMYMERLTAEPRFRDVKLVFANNAEIEETTVVQFSIQALPVGNLPLVEQTKKGARR